jgi:ER membrane protein complex subunit 3
MILVGVLRHYVTILLQGTPKVEDAKKMRQQHYLTYSQYLRNASGNLPIESFVARQSYLCDNFKNGSFLADPNAKPGVPNLTDPSSMDGMMGMMKSQIMTVVPQTLMMGWINAFFTGFVLMRLPFPLTVRFKAMLQTGVATTDLDVRWVSSLSWYFLNLLGLRSVYNLILGDNNSAGGVAAMGANPTAAMQQPGLDFSKLYQAEAENLELVKHSYLLDGIEKRILSAQ